jgi:molybdopterin molybdotransferase
LLQPALPLLPVDEAIRWIIAGVAPTPAERVPLDAADGRTLAESLAAQRTQPPFPASAMDGYAVRSADVANAPVELRLIGLSAAGHGFRGLIARGEAVRIFTGAPVPDGADAVLIQENAEARGDSAVVAREPVAAGRNIRPRGFDFAEGDVLLDAGRRLGMREIALAAAMGYADQPVRRRPRVAILATGDELVSPGVAPVRDQIVASNSVGIAAFVRRIGGAPHDLGIVADDAGAIGAAAERALAMRAETLVTLGGASVGEHDLVRDALAAKGMALDFWRIAMRPGKPLMFGRIPRPGAGAPEMRVLGLPGNPVSSLVCAILFLAPLVGAMLGQSFSDPSEPALLGADLPANDTRQDYLRATLAGGADGLPVATALPRQDSSMLSTLAAAGCLIIRPPNAAPARSGDGVRIIRLP